MQNQESTNLTPQPKQQQIDITIHSSSSQRQSTFRDGKSQRRLEHMQTKRLSFLIKRSDDSNEYAQLNVDLPNVYQSQVLLRVGSADYVHSHACLSGNDYFHFSKFKLPIIGLQKVKIYPDHVRSKTFHMKINHQQIVLSLGLQLKHQLNHLPQHYLWFAKLINSKLIKQGVHFKRCKYTSPLHQNGIFNKGIIYKCSKYRKKWQQRFVLINNEGLYSYKSQSDNYSVFIPTSTVEQLWTNFDIYSQKLIVKIMHKGEKTEFAIPILDYCVKEDCDNWLFSFYRLMMESRIHVKI